MSRLPDTDGAATPLTPDEADGLIPAYIASRHELNEAEQRNVLAAEQWAFSIKHRNMLVEPFVRALHKKMFGDVWRWAGRYRTTGRNIGIEAWRIRDEIKQLLDDVGYWIAHRTFSTDEIVVRLHHRMVWIHPFPNGNGRHARLFADLLITAMGGTRFSWGRSSAVDDAATRQAYITALRAADCHDIEPLLVFARS